MKITACLIALLLFVSFCGAQQKLGNKDLSNLVAIAELFSQNPNARGDEFAAGIEALRTPALNHVADALIAISKGDKAIVEPRFVARPSDDELMYWYVIREIHYNRTGDPQKVQPNDAVAKDVLARKIDTRWLLDNYYYRIHGGIASLFNTADLSTYNYELDKLGFKNDSEKAIFFLNMMDTLIGGRFQVLRAVKNNKRIAEFSARLPTFNGKPYYNFKNFDYDDFDWIGYDKIESYNERHIGGLYSTLLAQVNALAELGDTRTAHEVYVGSILHEPKYFRFSSAKNDLQKLYDQSTAH